MTPRPLYPCRLPASSTVQDARCVRCGPTIALQSLHAQPLRSGFRTRVELVCPWYAPPTQVGNMWDRSGVKYLTYFWPENGNCVIFDESNAVLDEIYGGC